MELMKLLRDILVVVFQAVALAVAWLTILVIWPHPAMLLVLSSFLVVAILSVLLKAIKEVTSRRA